MSKKLKLTKDVTETEFDNSYWYAYELKAFAKQLGIPNSSKLRKDELEKLIKQYIRTGEVKNVHEKNFKTTGAKDIEAGLTLSMKITNYTSNKETKQFIEREALKINPHLKNKPGVRYRLNRWREEQISNGKQITYGDLVKEYIRLNETAQQFEKIQSTRYINFLSEFLKNEKAATREQAIITWKQLKGLDLPKDYRSWKRHHNNISGKALE